MYNRYNFPSRYNNGFGLRRNNNNFILPFVLGGIAGSLWNNRPVVFYPTYPYYPPFY